MMRTIEVTLTIEYTGKDITEEQVREHVEKGAEEMEALLEINNDSFVNIFEMEVVEHGEVPVLTQEEMRLPLPELHPDRLSTGVVLSSHKKS
jgi:hypothetical protein